MELESSFPDPLADSDRQRGGRVGVLQGRRWSLPDLCSGSWPSEISPARNPVSVNVLGGLLMFEARFLGSKLFFPSVASRVGIPNLAWRWSVP